MTRRDALAPLLAAVGAFAVYVATLAPGVTFEDSGELIAAAFVAGVPHQPGYPLYMMLGHLFAQLPLGSVAWRLNLFSALCTAAGVFCFTLALQRCLAATTPAAPRWRSAALAACGGLLAALSRECWSQSLIAEVYGLNLALFGLTLHLATRWLFAAEPARQERDLVLLALVLGLATSHHSSAALWAPALLLVALVQRPRQVLQPRLIAQAVGAFLLGLAPLLYLPLASARDPAMDWGDPETLENFLHVISRHQYGLAPVASLAEAAAQLKFFGQLVAGQWPPAALALLPAGLWLLTRRARPLLGLVAALWVLAGPLVALLTNFPVATSNPITNAENSALAAVFFIPAHWLLALLLALGAALVLERLSAPLARPATALTLALPLAVAGAHWGRVDMSQQDFAARYVEGLFRIAGPGALIIAPWDPYYFPTLYYQIVERQRPDVVVIDQAMLGQAWYVRQLQQRQPGVMDPVRREADAFLEAVAPFEADLPHDYAFIMGKYYALLNALIDRAFESGRPVLLTHAQEAGTAESYALEPLYWALRLRRDGAVTPVDPLELNVPAFLSPAVTNDRMAVYVRDHLENMIAARGTWCLGHGGCPDAAALVDLAPRFAAVRKLSAGAR
jgi:hypothetical protein